MQINLNRLHSAKVEDFSNKGVLMMTCCGQTYIKGRCDFGIRDGLDRNLRNIKMKTSVFL
jgi:hypothetical protein